MNRTKSTPADVREAEIRLRELISGLPDDVFVQCTVATLNLPGINKTREYPQIIMMQKL